MQSSTMPATCSGRRKHRRCRPLARWQNLLQVIQIGHAALTQHGIDHRCHGMIQ